MSDKNHLCYFSPTSNLPPRPSKRTVSVAYTPHVHTQWKPLPPPLKAALNALEVLHTSTNRRESGSKYTIDHLRAPGCQHGSVFSGLNENHQALLVVISERHSVWHLSHVHRDFHMKLAKQMPGISEMTGGFPSPSSPRHKMEKGHKRKPHYGKCSFNLLLTLKYVCYIMTY